ncbi:hypothetical protein E4U72_28440 (plasmid) [Escherichia coli O157:H7]|nr:hypothetical protein [Escherichia coli]EAE5926223.1 hypothetical protein [Listeria monocytogenes]NAL94600.1 hypothetical protein [Escherichia coli O157:H7]QKA72242.1 hypothetical protein E4U83_28360 [Escherichia coli O157:H7 str. F8092B]EAB9761299.1 hypothetical protein [Escherichia coli]
MEHLCCSEVSISPLFRWPNSVCHYNHHAFSHHYKGRPIFIHAVYLFLREFSLQDFRGGSYYPRPLANNSPINGTSRRLNSLHFIYSGVLSLVRRT